MSNISIYELIYNYKQKIYNTISLFKSNIVVFDFDGTLTEFKYTENNLLPCKDDDLFEYSKKYNLYNNVHILKTMQYILKELDINNVYILTVSVDTLKAKKQKCILDNFNIKEQNIIQVSSISEKINFLENLYKEKQTEIIFVEDTAKTLLIAEEQFSFIKGFHISSLIP